LLGARAVDYTQGLMTRLVAIGAIIGFALAVLALSLWPKAAVAPTAAPVQALRPIRQQKLVAEPAVPLPPPTRE
jgi:hypothetical protein